jgi:prephenate dehydrogenase
MVWVSHLPQFLSNALAKALLTRGYSRADLGPGGRDMTRLAGSSPEMWQDLAQAAGLDLARAIEEVRGEVDRLREWLSAGEIEALLELMSETREWHGGGE